MSTDERMNIEVEVFLAFWVAFCVVIGIWM